MPQRPLVVDVAEAGQQVRLQGMNQGAVDVTTGPAIVPIAPLGGTYWVDNTAAAGGDGSDELPFSTIAAGIAAIAAQALQVGTLLMAGRPDYTAEGLIAVPNGITLCIFNWRAPSQQPVSFSLSATGTPLIFLRGCNVALTLGDAIVQTDMTSIVATSSTGGSTLVMRGGSSRLSSQVCRLTGSWDDAACSLMHVGTVEGALDCVSLRCDACAVEGLTLVAASAEFRTTAFSTPLAITATTISMDRQSERSAALAGVRPSTLPVSLEPTEPTYGTGATGNVTLNAGSVALTGLEEYENLTITGTGAVRCEPFILRVRGLLNLATANALAIRDFTGGGGSDAAGPAGGGAWGGVGGSTQGNSGTLQAPSGATGDNDGGAQATAATALQNAFGGKGGAVGAGGDGAGGVGGAARAAATVTNARVVPHWPITFVGPASNATGGSAITPPQPIMGGMVGQAGSAGGGSGAAAGGGGGGAGRGGGSVVVYARGIQLGAGTAVGAISAVGQPAGDGGVGALNAGGGSGGAGGGGGFVLIAYDWIIGAQPAGDEVTASGGGGGDGGAGAGTGIGGFGGGGGDGGQIVFWNLLTNARTIVTGAAGVAGSAPVGTVGGAPGAGGACTADFP